MSSANKLCAARTRTRSRTRAEARARAWPLNGRQSDSLDFNIFTYYIKVEGSSD